MDTGNPRQVPGFPRDSMKEGLDDVSGMPGSLRLLCVPAHADDESLGVGGTLARCAAKGIEPYIATPQMTAAALESDLFEGLR